MYDYANVFYEDYMTVFTDTDNLVALACLFRADFREGGKPKFPEKEAAEPQET